MNYLLIVLMTCLAAFASLFLKRASGAGKLRDIALNVWLWVGGILYVLSSVINIWLLRRMPYSIVVPSGAICYVWTLIISRMILNERITYRKIIGVAFIIVGVACIAI